MKMDIKEQQIKIKDLVEGYVNNDEEGVIGYGGKLNIRPIYQREFRYGEKEKHAVINTVLQGFPLNTFYWAKNNENGFEVLDGQQRTLSICEYFKNRFSYTFPNSDMPMYYDNLQPDHKEKFLNYKILTYLCSGTPSQKLEWFEVINIKGLDLTPQERKNAVFAGPWTTDAKRYFSKTGCAVGFQNMNDIMAGLKDKFGEDVIGLEKNPLANLYNLGFSVFLIYLMYHLIQKSR